MITMSQDLEKVRSQVGKMCHVVGWEMSADEAVAYIKNLNKKVITFFGYSGSGYENTNTMLDVVQRILLNNSPESALVNIGVTSDGVGSAYKLAKSMGYTTTGIVSNIALEYPDTISEFVDHVCFIKDSQWGGKMPDSDELSPTSKAMVEVSDLLVGIGGNAISRDELLYGKKLGKPIQFFAAEINHEWSIRRARTQNKPDPEHFFGDAHDVFGEMDEED